MIEVHRPGCRREEGFTLVEMLVALLVLALIATLASAAILFAANASTRAGTSNEYKRVNAIQSLTTNLIERARPVFGAVEGGRPGTVFIGTKDRLVFVARTPAPTELPGLYVIELSHAAQRRNSSVLIRYWPFVSDLEIQTPPDNAVGRNLLNDVRSVKFSYGLYTVEDGWSWEENWRVEDEGLPHMISIEILGKPGNAVNKRWEIPLQLRPLNQVR